MPRIILIGLRGTGKTTVGRILGEQLQEPFVDLDDRIQSQAGKSIREIFAEEGEVGFRNRESAALQQLQDELVAVIATGGGAILSSENRTLLQQLGFVVWLTAQPETLWQRLQTDVQTVSTRPNLTLNGGLEEVKTLATQREPLYREIAQITIFTENQSPNAIAADILLAWNTYCKSRRFSGS